MKNKRKEEKPAGHPANAIATIDAIPFLEGLVRYLAERRSQVSHVIESTHPGWEKIDTSTVETFVSGNCILPDEKVSTKTPFTGCFIFTCTRGDEGAYQLMWSNSLS
jgi:hypothetical protein